MRDTDWRPSNCPECGRIRNAAEHPVCDNPDCAANPKGKRTMNKKEPERYVWIRANGDATIIDTDIVELWQSPCFDKQKDRIYRLGEEVEIRVTVEVKNKKPVYR